MAKLLALLFLLSLPFEVLSQKGDKEFEAFFKEFRTAFSTQDKVKLAGLIRFPLIGNGDEEFFNDWGTKYSNDSAGLVNGGYKSLFYEESVAIFSKLLTAKDKGFILKFNKKPYEISCGFMQLKDYLLLNTDDKDLAGMEGYVLETALYYKEGDAGYSFMYFFAKIDGAYKLVKFYMQ